MKPMRENGKWRRRKNMELYAAHDIILSPSLNTGTADDGSCLRMDYSRSNPSVIVLWILCAFFIHYLLTSY